MHLKPTTDRVPSTLGDFFPILWASMEKAP